MNILDTAHHYRRQLKQRGKGASQQIESAHAQAKHAIQPHLDHIYRGLNAELQKLEKGAKIPLTWLHGPGKLEQIKQIVAAHIQHFADLAHMTVQHLVEWAGQLGKQAMQAMLNVKEITAQAARSASSKLGSLFRGFGTEAAQSVQDALMRGVTLANKVETIAKEVAQALDVSRWRSLTIADTEGFGAFNDVSMDVMQDNAHLVDGWMWICQLSARSCATCVALHGTIHALDETLDDHPNGSCIKAPYVRGGPAIQTGLDWFGEQDETTQRAIIGTRVAYDLYSSGSVSLSDFVGIRHSEEHGDSVYQRSAREISSG